MKAIIIIPTYNERENIGKLIQILEEEVFPKIKKHEMHILVVDDSSPDGTGKVVLEKMKQYGNLHLFTNKEKKGLGGAYLIGMNYAFYKLGADVIFEMDADLSHDPTKIPKFLDKIDEDYDFVLGSRYIKGGSIPADWAFYRKFLSKVGNIVIRGVLTNFEIHDWTTGYRAIKKWVFEKVKDKVMTTRSYAFQTSFLYYATKVGAKVAEVPFHFVDRKYGKSKLGKENVKTVLFFILKARFQEIFTPQFIKFSIVGFTGFIINTIGLEVFVRLGIRPSISGMLGAEIAIISNFILNNFWTFAAKKIVSWRRVPIKFIQFNITSIGAVFIQGGTIELGTSIFGDLMNSIFSGILTPYWGNQGYRLFFIIGVGFGLIWNYFNYTTFVWKTRKSRLFGWLQKKVG